MGHSNSPNGSFSNTEKRNGWKFSWKKTCGKTITAMGRQQQDGIIDATQSKRMEEIS
jgi:hypothetical protein